MKFLFVHLYIFYMSYRRFINHVSLRRMKMANLHKSTYRNLKTMLSLFKSIILRAKLIKDFLHIE